MTKKKEKVKMERRLKVHVATLSVEVSYGTLRSAGSVPRGCWLVQFGSTSKESWATVWVWHPRGKKMVWRKDVMDVREMHVTGSLIQGARKGKWFTFVRGPTVLPDAAARSFLTSIRHGSRNFLNAFSGRNEATRHHQHHGFRGGQQLYTLQL